MTGHIPGLSSSLPSQIVDMLVYCEYPCPCITQCDGRISCGAICDTGEEMPSNQELLSLTFWEKWAYPKLHKDGYSIAFEGSKCFIASKKKRIEEDAGDMVGSFCWALQEVLIYQNHTLVKGFEAKEKVRK